MATPRVQRVWAALVAALEQIRHEDGYHTTVRNVTTDLVDLTKVAAVQTPWLVVFFDAERSVLTPVGFGRAEHELVFDVEFRIDAPGVVTSAKVAAYAELTADIERALVQDPTLGGVANWVLPRGKLGPFVGMDAGGIVLGRQAVSVLCERQLGEE